MRPSQVLRNGFQKLETSEEIGPPETECLRRSASAELEESNSHASGLPLTNGRIETWAGGLDDSTRRSFEGLFIALLAGTGGWAVLVLVGYAVARLFA